MGEVNGGRNPNVPEVQHEEESDLFRPLQLGPFKLAHRIVMAPLTRMRSTGGIPQPQAALYYGQRATPGGLLIAEATNISETAVGRAICTHTHCFTRISTHCPKMIMTPVPRIPINSRLDQITRSRNTPDIYSEEQVEAWKPVVKAVHDKGAIFFLQIWHVGRQSHSSYQPNGAKPLSSSNKRILSFKKMGKHDGKLHDFEEPHALELHEIPGIVDDFVHAARNVMAAGFDGVELHGAHGYLLDQFMKDGVNDRTDEYGGSLENRCRFPLEVVDAVIAAIGADRVGIRLSPYSHYSEAIDSNPAALGTYMAQELSKRNLLYVHFVEPRIKSNSLEVEVEGESLWPFRKALTSGAFFAAGGYDREQGIQAVRSGKADAIVFGRWFISNPDLVKRLRLNAPLTKYNRDTFYIADQVVGYTDYPFLEEAFPEYASKDALAV